MKSLVFGALVRTPLPALMRAVNRRKVLIVIYHGFCRGASPDPIYPDLHLPVEAFRRQLDFLQAHYDVVPLDYVVACYQRGEPLPSRTAVITIDDGYRSVHDLAFPELRQRGLPASVFLATEFVDARQPLWHDRIGFSLSNTTRGHIEVTLPDEQRRFDIRDLTGRREAHRVLRNAIKGMEQERIPELLEQVERETRATLTLEEGAEPHRLPMTWERVRRLLRSGLVSIGSHTAAHVVLSRCTEARIANELRRSKETIEKETGTPCRLFCYPNGAAGDFNATTRRLVADSGYTCGLVTVPGLNGPTADLLALRRLSSPPNMSEFRVTSSGLRRLLVRAGSTSKSATRLNGEEARRPGWWS